ncbi:uncharacterized protein BDZ99DRAFT_560096 [Mytilinidion resinicola]|uniref:RING-type domain-containing protein n=1 Tax=Mytilinidion resinicola TaxID=574789 RepID=A0A6A6YUU1_9PEZI|nr:uncharacterized protein BDZ99DRAFT_560096 [Mytilinidion resinicola]KAF2811735.1 hypothetical protein BDZ99DRAFT_560096 [Mytilinidion resinicola]
MPSADPHSERFIEALFAQPSDPFPVAMRFIGTKILHLTRNVPRTEWQHDSQQGYKYSRYSEAKSVFTTEYLRTHLPEQYCFLLDLAQEGTNDHWDEFFNEIVGLTVAIYTWKHNLCQAYVQPFKAPITVETSSQPVDVANLSPDDRECSICHESLVFAGAEPAVKTHCEHTMGRDCLNTWITSGAENASKCPICRQEFLSTNPPQRRPGRPTTNDDYSDIVAMFPAEARVQIAVVESCFAALGPLESITNECLLELQADQARSSTMNTLGARLHALKFHELIHHIMELLKELQLPSAMAGRFIL